VDAFLIQPAALLQATPEPQDGLLVEDGDGVARLAFEDDEPDGVRAEIDDREAGGEAG